MSPESKSPRRRPPTRARVKQLPRRSICGPPTRVYVAMPVSAFGTSLHERALAAVRDRFPTSELVDASELFDDSADRRRRWPAIVRTLDHLVFAAHEGLIGAGVFQEVLDARFEGVTVEYVSSSGAFVPIEEVTLRMLADGDPRRFAEVRISRRR